MKYICPICHKETASNFFTKHLESHKQFSFLQLLNIFQQVILQTHFLKAEYFPEEFNKRLLLEYEISDFRKYVSYQFQLIFKKYRHFCSLIKKFREPETKDIDVFFEKYLPYRAVNPKAQNSFELALICCGGNKSQAEKFYSSVLKPKNPFTGHDGKLSPFSRDFNAYKGMPDQEIDNAIVSRTFNLKRKDFANLNNPLTTEYFIRKGFSPEDAENLLKQRQATFSLQKCIQKYGEDLGNKIFIERQQKWFKALKHKSYSEISQSLFWILYERLKPLEVFFATNDNGIYDTAKNHEFKLKLNRSYASLDFYVPALKKCIEFDGDYWHSGTSERDKLRQFEIKQKIPEIHIFRVKEKDFRNRKDKIISDCLCFLCSSADAGKIS